MGLATGLRFTNDQILIYTCCPDISGLRPRGHDHCFFVTFWVFEENLNENLQTTLFNFGQDIVRVYETIPLREADLFVSGMKQLDSYYIRIFDETGQFQSYGMLNGQKPVTVTMDQVRKVLDGEVVQVNPSSVSMNLLGLRLKTEMGMKAMFVEPLMYPSTSFAQKWLFTF